MSEGVMGLGRGTTAVGPLLATAAILAVMEVMWLPFSLESQEVWQWDICLLQFSASWLLYAASAELAAMESSDLSFCWDVISNKGKGPFFRSVMECVQMDLGPSAVALVKVRGLKKNYHVIGWWLPLELEYVYICVCTNSWLTAWEMLLLETGLLKFSLPISAVENCRWG